MRQRENKYFHSVTSLPDAKKKIKKKQQKIEKIEKYHYGFISIQNRLENHETERK